MFTTNQIHDLLTNHKLVRNKVSDGFGKLNTQYKKHIDAATQELNTTLNEQRERILKNCQNEDVHIHLHKTYDFYWVAVMGFGVAIGGLVILAMKAGYGI